MSIISREDELAEQIRLGILGILGRYLVAEDQMSRMLMKLLKRFLAHASLTDLVQVLHATEAFSEEMRPFVDDYIKRLGDRPELRSELAGRGDGQGVVSGQDEIRQVNLSETVGDDILEEVSETVEEILTTR